jgi:hypothetical protein
MSMGIPFPRERAFLVSRVRDPLSTEAADAPGWQGAKTEDIGNI